jgi:hypothetical protein
MGLKTNEGDSAIQVFGVEEDRERIIGKAHTPTEKMDEVVAEE